MYAEPRSRGGILEPEGVLAVKFKSEGHLLKKLQERLNVDQKLASRIALKFIELHDTAGRMEAKQVIRKVVPWEESRNFFIDRLDTIHKNTGEYKGK